MSPDIPLGLQWLGGMCENGNDIAALLVISGSLRREVQCPQAPREVRHVHGTNDTVMDYGVISLTAGWAKMLVRGMLWIS